MKLDKPLIITGVLAVSAWPVVSCAAGMLGDPTAIGAPGKFEIQVGGGKVSDLKLDFNQTTAAIQIGSVSQSGSYPPASGSFSEDQAFVGLNYALNSRAQLFANIGTGNDSGSKSSSRAIGVKFSPSAESSGLRTGLMLRVQQVKSDSNGLSAIPQPFDVVNDGTNVYAVTGLLHGTDHLKYTRMDALFGVSKSTGIYRPYGGLCVTRISGTNEFTLDDTADVQSYPVAGGPVSYSTPRVIFNVNTDISASRYVSAVLGLDVIPDQAVIAALSAAELEGVHLLEECDQA